MADFDPIEGQTPPVIAGNMTNAPAVVDPATREETDQVFFGATVTVLHENGEQKIYSIVGIDEADVSRGRISYAGDSGVIISGGVDPGGHVSVSLRYGQSSAQGSGRLSRSDGGGRWQGASSGSRCSGRWLAERRG